MKKRLAPAPVLRPLPRKLHAVRPLTPEQRFVRGVTISDRDALAELYTCDVLPVGVRLLFGRILDRLDALEARTPAQHGAAK
jgi:hypothetical protein